MNKKLIALALAALPVAAMADVTLYGTLNVGVEAGSGGKWSSNGGVKDYTSILGFKGSEDMGNGLKTIWQIESGFDATGSSTSTLATRQTFIGLDGGNLGTIRMGKLNSALKDQYAVDQWQYNGGTTNYNTDDNRGVNGLAIMTNPANRLKNALRYDTANFGGFTANVEYGFGENRKKSSQGNVSTSSDVVSLGLNYAFSGALDGLGLHYAYQREANPSVANNTSVSNSAQTGGNAKSAHINLFEVDYNANNLFVGLAYQDALGYAWTDSYSGDSTGSQAAFGNQTPVQAGLKTRQAALSVAYTIGAFTPKATYAKGWDMKTNAGTINNSGYKQFILGVDYALSKRTSAELAYGNLKADANSGLGYNGESNTYSTLALSLMHNF